LESLTDTVPAVPDPAEVPLELGVEPPQAAAASASPAHA